MADGWHTTRQVQRNVLLPGGGFGEVVTVYFQTDHGYSGSVDVPMSQFGPDVVKQLIEAQVAKIDDVHNL